MSIASSTRNIRCLKVLMLVALSQTVATSSNNKAPNRSVKRAVLVGIDVYDAQNQGKIGNLNGPVHDVAAMASVLEKRFGFDSDNVLTLTDSSATRKNILSAIQRHLLDDASPGDLSVFYFSGHGSQRFNSLSNKPDHWDQTIVPADILKGTGASATEAIRDKELAISFKAILSKGIILTTIFDSCYSGSITRGLSGSAVPKFSFKDYRDVRDPGIAGKTTEELGGLLFAAAQPDEEAQEPREGNPILSFFTSALVRSLNSLPVDAPSSEVLRAVTQQLQIDGQTGQHPKLGGPQARPLFGTVVRENSALRLLVGRSNTDGTYELDGGKILGLGVGSVFTKTGAREVSDTQLQLSDASALTSSTAKLIAGDPKSVHTNDLFEMVKWVPADDQRLRVWIPPPFPAASVARLNVALHSLRESQFIDWITDPIVQSPTYTLEWDGTTWLLRSTGHDQIVLDSQLDAQQVILRLRSEQKKPALFAYLPPTEDLWRELNKHLGRDEYNTPVELVGRSEAQYLFVGRLDGDHWDYAWVLPNTVQNPESAKLELVKTNDVLCSNDSALPLRSDWFSTAQPDILAATQGIEDRAFRIGKLAAMLSLSTPFGGEYPYELRLRNRTSGELLDGGVTREGDFYEYELVAASQDLMRGVKPRWTYIFTIDCTGRGQLLFPGPEDGNTSNLLPSFHDIQMGLHDHIPIDGERFNFCVDEPFGRDTYFLLTSDQSQPVQDTRVFNFEPVLRGDGNTPSFNPLTRLLANIGSAQSRSESDHPIPTVWSIQKIYVQSVPDTRHHCPTPVE